MTSAGNVADALWFDGCLIGCDLRASHQASFSFYGCTRIGLFHGWQLVGLLSVQTVAQEHYPGMPLLSSMQMIFDIAKQESQ
ncbi:MULTISPECIES: hypothetical protein [unclassified Pseudomonas]|uniref:hypothetical protein n=1 Tax=unclassified Pseudomonas TaxID=196821 RepID=UPI0025D04C38|nr:MULTISPECIES: hypothetical protein [unclassified Pseudomonas]